MILARIVLKVRSVYDQLFLVVTFIDARFAPRYPDACRAERAAPPRQRLESTTQITQIAKLKHT